MRLPPFRPTGRRRLGGDRRGSTVIEFAIISPVMLLLIMGLGDVLYQEYAQSILNGAVQKAGRDSAIQGGGDITAAIDGKVVTMIDSIMQTPVQACPATAASTWCSTRENYDTFTEVAPEPFTDNDNDGLCDHGEPFTDVNANGVWDADPGQAGQGGANDVTLYTMTVTYPRLFPVMKMLGVGSTQTIVATTLLKNQPYATQTVTATKTGTCH